MRVLHVIDSLIQAGAEALVKDMVPRMRSSGVEVSIAVLKELDSPFERELRELNITFLPTAAGRDLFAHACAFPKTPHSQIRCNSGLPFPRTTVRCSGGRAGGE